MGHTNGDVQYQCSSPPLSAVSLSVVSVTWGQPQSENIKWEILSSVMESCTMLIHLTQDVNRPFV